MVWGLWLGREIKTFAENCLQLEWCWEWAVGLGSMASWPDALPWGVQKDVFCQCPGPRYWVCGLPRALVGGKGHCCCCSHS